MVSFRVNRLVVMVDRNRHLVGEGAVASFVLQEMTSDFFVFFFNPRNKFWVRAARASKSTASMFSSEAFCFETARERTIGRAN